MAYIQRIYSIYGKYSTQIRLPPPLYYTAYVPYNTYNYTYKVLANPVKT